MRPRFDTRAPRRDETELIADRPATAALFRGMDIRAGRAHGEQLLACPMCRGGEFRAMIDSATGVVYLRCPRCLRGCAAFKLEET